MGFAEKSRYRDDDDIKTPHSLSRAGCIHKALSYAPRGLVLPNRLFSKSFAKLRETFLRSDKVNYLLPIIHKN